MNSFLRSTKFAFHLATPVEGARAPLHHDHFLSPVAATAAHQVTAVDADRRVVTLPSVRALDAQARILLAEARGRLQVH